MKVVEIGNISDTHLFMGPEAAPLPRCGLIIEATPDEIKELSFNPVFAEVTIVPKYGQKAPQNARAGFDR